MGTRDSRFDAYIAKSADFAQPILVHLRDVVHSACPDAEEAMKWSHPNFMYQGMMCGMAAFKAHCTFGFWKSELIVGGDATTEAAMGQFGRITKVSDLPSKKVLTGYIEKAMKLNAEGVKAPWLEKRAKPKPATKVPDDLSAALAKNKKSRTVFEAFPPGQRREYIEWITEGKRRNWKYENC